MSLDLLLKTAARGELHHSIIFFGPSRETLRSAALSVARALNCDNTNGTDSCSSCLRIDRGVHPDIHLVGVEDDRKMIAVEQIREVIAGASLRPYEGRTKVYVIDSAESMSVSSANALLKTLEEPTRDTAFFLLTRTPDLLLPTIRSRSQQVQIRDEIALPAAELVKRDGISLQVARLRVMLPSIEPSDIEKATTAFFDALSQFAADGNTAALLQLAARFCSVEPSADALALFSALCRDAASLRDSDSDDVTRLRMIRGTLAPERFLAAADVAMKGVGRLTVNVDVRPILESAVAELIQ